jgi:hypothetical protein
MKFIRKDGYVDLTVQGVHFSTLTVEKDELGLVEVVIQITHTDGSQELCYFTDLLEELTVEELVFMTAEAFDFEDKQVAA